MGTFKASWGINPTDGDGHTNEEPVNNNQDPSQSDEGSKIVGDYKTSSTPEPGGNQRAPNLPPAAPQRPDAQRDRAISQYVQARTQRWSQQDFATFVENARREIAASETEHPEATSLLTTRFRAILKQRLEALMTAPQTLDVKQLEAMAAQAALEQEARGDFVQIFLRISEVLSARRMAIATANEGDQSPSSESAGASASNPDIARMPPGDQAEAVEELVAAASSRTSMGVLTRKVASVLQRLAQPDHIASLPKAEGKALFRELANASMYCRRPAQSEIATALVESFRVLKQATPEDFNLLLEAVGRSAYGADPSWLAQLNLDLAITRLPPTERESASARALKLRISHNPTGFGQLPPAEAKAMFDGLLPELGNRDRAYGVQMAQTLLDHFSKLQGATLAEFEKLLEAATRIPTDGGNSPLSELRFSPAIAVLPAAQQAKAIARVAEYRALFGPTIFSRPSVAEDLAHLAREEHLATLPAQHREEVARAVRNAREKFKLKDEPY